MKTLLSAAALFGLLLVAGAGSPAAASDNQRREAPIGAPAWNPNLPANGQVELLYVNDNDDDDDYDGGHNRRYNPWPYSDNGWNNNGNNGWNNGWNNTWNNNWNNGWNNNWNNQWPQYQQPVRGRPLPHHVIVFRLKQHHFYNVQSIKLKKDYYRVYAFDRHGRPVSVIVNPYTGRILRVGRR